MCKYMWWLQDIKIYFHLLLPPLLDTLENRDTFEQPPQVFLGYQAEI